LKYLVILRGPQCSGKTEVSEKLKEKLDKDKPNQTCILRLDEINPERFESSLNKALNETYNYILGELNYGDSHRSAHNMVATF
jgi:tRNA uridine 5-carbamoylmethylation protein Kti12